VISFIDGFGCRLRFVILLVGFLFFMVINEIYKWDI
jgi:hypothetical protein